MRGVLSQLLLSWKREPNALPEKIEERMGKPHPRSLENKHVHLEAVVMFVDPEYVRVMIGGIWYDFTNEQLRVALITE